MKPNLANQAIAEPHKELSSSVGTHNLTELRRRLEEKMLLKVHDENRTSTANREEWQSFNSTPYEDDQDEREMEPFAQREMN